jgi:hypothetical protein
MTVRLPAGLGAELELYADEQGWMVLLAPRGWSCGAGYGADGSGGVAVFPAGEKLPSGRLPADSAVAEVSGSETSACSGCTLGQACALFGSAARDYHKYFGSACPVARPAGETVVQLNAGLVAFADPAGVSGDGFPSGGRYPANGVMTYNPRSPDGSWLETCTLPPADKSLCTAILNYFVNSYQNR